VDKISAEQRSEIMRRVRGKDTTPELAVRKLVYGMGFRYRLHVRDLPGTPDLVFRPRWKVIFVHGCFWHRHSGCRCFRAPKSNVSFWASKLEKNANRDRRNQRLLKRNGWDYLVIWECQLRDPRALTARIQAFFRDSRQCSGLDLNTSK